MRPRSTCLDLIAGNREGLTFDDVLDDLRRTDSFDLQSGMALISRIGTIYQALYGEDDQRTRLVWAALGPIASEATRRGIDPKTVDLSLHFGQWFVALSEDNVYSRAVSSQGLRLLHAAMGSALAEPAVAALPERYVRDLRLIGALTKMVLEQRGIDPGPPVKPWTPA